MNWLKIKVNKCKFLIVQKGYTDSSELGYTGEDDKFVGFSEFNIPAEHREGLIDFYGEAGFKEFILRGEEVEDSWCFVDSGYRSSDADVFIYWMHYVVNNISQYTLELDCEHLFWVVHDLMHAKHDFSSGTFYCSPYNELIRHRQAYKALRRRKIRVTDEFLQPIIDVFNKQNWGCYGAYKQSRREVSLSTIKNFKQIDHILL